MNSIHSSKYCILYIISLGNNFVSWMTDRKISGKLSRGRAPIKPIIPVRASGIVSSYSSYRFNQFMSNLESGFSILCHASGLSDYLYQFWSWPCKEMEYHTLLITDLVFAFKNDHSPNLSRETQCKEVIAWTLKYAKRLKWNKL